MVVVIHDDVIVVVLIVACLCVVEAIVIGDEDCANFNNVDADVVLFLYF
jgi:phosphate starvation-inducible membrane PsiE